jgi:quercetin dioxygenase-like cupin family protein
MGQKRERNTEMKSSMSLCIISALLITSVSSLANEHGTARPQLILSEVVQGMPKGEKQEVRVFTANFKPGDKTVFHTHRFPVVVYVLEGEFRLEMEGRNPITVKTGQAFVEPQKVKMTGYNRSSTEPLRVMIFYVSDPDSPFLDVVR